jgi:hypothetical protein
LEIAEQLTPTELNPECMEYETIDKIKEIHLKGTRHQRIHLYRLSEQGKLLHQGKWLT